VLVSAEDSPTVAARVVVGSTAIAALAVLCLGLFHELGVGAFLAACVLALATIKVPR
jgi:hypothetical protein